MTLAAAHAAASASSDPAAWIAIVVAGIAMVGTIIASIVAARSAKSTKKAEIQAQRIGELEERISERKYEIYKPMIELFRDATNPKQIANLNSDEIVGKLHEFFIWIGIYGSDDSIIAFRNFQQAAFSGAPSEISMRLYAEFVLAIRRDIAHPDTRITPVEIIGMKIDDLYTNLDNYRIMSLPFDEVCKRYDWTPPWSAKNVENLKKQKTAIKLPGSSPTSTEQPSAQSGQ